MSIVKLEQGICCSVACPPDEVRPPSWGAVAARCSCGVLNDALSHDRLRRTGIGLGARCGACRELFLQDSPRNDVVARKVRDAVSSGSLSLANQILFRMRDKLEQVAALVHACPHCGETLTTEEAQAAASALLKLVDPDDDPDT